MYGFSRTATIQSRIRLKTYCSTVSCFCCKMQFVFYFALRTYLCPNILVVDPPILHSCPPNEEGVLFSESLCSYTSCKFPQKWAQDAKSQLHLWVQDPISLEPYSALNPADLKCSPLKSDLSFGRLWKS